MKTPIQLFLFLIFSFATTLMFSQPLPPTCPGHPNCKNGGGGNNNPIICHWPMHGNIINKPHVFKWEPMDGAREYVFKLFNSDGDELHTETTTNTAVFINLPGLNLVIDNQYVIVISADNDTKSNNHRFTLKSEADYQNVINLLNSDPEYNLTSGTEKHIRKSNFMFDQGWNLAAIKAINFETDNVTDMMKVTDHFRDLLFRLDPVED